MYWAALLVRYTISLTNSSPECEFNSTDMLCFVYQNVSHFDMIFCSEVGWILGYNCDLQKGHQNYGSNTMYFSSPKSVIISVPSHVNDFSLTQSNILSQPTHLVGEGKVAPLQFWFSSSFFNRQEYIQLGHNRHFPWGSNYTTQRNVDFS